MIAAMAEPEPKRAAAERAIVEETPVEALASDSATIAVVEESAVTALLSFAAAPAQGDGPDHYRPDSPDDFRVACRDVSMPLPE